jgi:hypothetical protein
MINARNFEGSFTTTMPDSSFPDNLMGSLTVFKGDASMSVTAKFAAAETAELPFSLSQGSVVLQAVVFLHLQIILEPQYQSIITPALRVAIKP